MTGKDFVGFGFADIKDQHRYNAVASRFGPQVPIYQLKSVRGFTGQNGIGKADFGQQATQGVRLILGMGSPVFWIGE